MTAPKIGMSFNHSKWLDSNNMPALCHVTKIAQGVVYFRFDGGHKAKHYVPIEQFAAIVKA